MKYLVSIILILVSSYGYAQYSKVFIHNDTIEISRFPENQLKSKAKQHVIELQKGLEKNYQLYLNETKTEKLEHLEHQLRLIYFADNKFPTKRYANELEKYKEYNRWLYEKTRQAQMDSISRITSGIMLNPVKKEPVETINVEISDQDRKQASIKAYGRTRSHDYFTVFTGGIEYSFSHYRLVGFLNKYLGMTEQSQDFENGYITSIVREGIHKGNPAEFTIKYKVYPEDGFYYIENVTITGRTREMIMFFLRYWDTKLQLDNVKQGEWTYYYQLPDRIGIMPYGNNTAKIVIENTQNKIP